MWRKPPERVEESCRALVLLGTILASFLSLKLIAFGLPLPQRLPWMTIGLLPPLSVFALVLFNPKLRAERRYAQAIAEELSPDPKFTVRATLLREEVAYGHDSGVLTLSGGCLQFHGLATSFSIPRARIQMRQDAQPAKIALLIEVDGDPIGIDLWDHSGRAIPAPLLEGLDGFWKAPSTGAFVPPPTSAQPRVWSGRFFPGWRQVAFWALINLLVIVQAQILNTRGLHAAQGLLALGFCGTLAVALAIEVFRLARLMREVEKDALPSRVPLASRPRLG